MGKKIHMGAAFLLVLFLISSMATLSHSYAYDCLDVCYTGCVNSDSRLMQRCEGKCQISCGPDVVETEGSVGG